MIAHRRTRTHGFTLIELLVVIAIISLLVSILIPSLQKAKDLARRAASMANLRSIGLGMTLYAEQFDGALPALPSGTPSNCRYWEAEQLDALTKEMGCFTDNGPGGWYADGGYGANERYSPVFLSPCNPEYDRLIGYSSGGVLCGYHLTTSTPMLQWEWGPSNHGYRMETPARIDQTQSEYHPNLPFSTVIVSDGLNYIGASLASWYDMGPHWRGNGVPGYRALESSGDPANAPSGSGCLNLHLMGNVEWRPAGEVEMFIDAPGWNSVFF